MDNKRESIRAKIERYHNSGEWGSNLLLAYKLLGTYKAVADKIGASESGVYRVIRELELQAIANGNGVKHAH